MIVQTYRAEAMVQSANRITESLSDEKQQRCVVSRSRHLVEGSAVCNEPAIMMVLYCRMMRRKKINDFETDKIEILNILRTITYRIERL